MDIEDKSTKIIKIKGSLFFGTASILDRRIDKVRARTKTLVLDCLEVSVLDLSAIFMLEEIITRLKNRDIEVILLLKISDKKRVINLDRNNIFKNIPIFNKIDFAVNSTPG
ncbi:MAG: STAS domain-containing protein [Halarcobacter ebronensis]